MWKRSELKQRGKKAFFANYWKTVLVSYLLTIILGGIGAAGGFSGGFSNGFSGMQNMLNVEDEPDQEFDELEAELGEELEEFEVEDVSVENAVVLATSIIVVGIIFVVVFFVIYVVCLVVSFAFNAFLINPLQLGTDKFFLTNLNEKAAVKHMGYGFDSNYKNVVLTLFKRMIYTFLWSLLFVIPGIVKSYAYRMVPYILAENPNMKPDEVLALSNKMMYGQKWKAFVLDLSFLGWHILSAMTGGILGTFYVNPYQNMTNAALYEALKEITPVEIEAPVYGMTAGE